MKTSNTPSPLLCRGVYTFTAIQSQPKNVLTEYILQLSHSIRGVRHNSFSPPPAQQQQQQPQQSPQEGAALSDTSTIPSHCSTSNTGTNSSTNDDKSSNTSTSQLSISLHAPRGSPFVVDGINTSGRFYQLQLSYLSFVIIHTYQPSPQRRSQLRETQPQPQLQTPSPLYSAEKKRRHKHTEEDKSRRSSAKKQYIERESPIDSSPSSSVPAAAGTVNTVHVAVCPTSIDSDQEQIENVTLLNIAETMAALFFHERFWSENIQCRDHTPKLADSEAAYLGETLLSASKQLPPPAPTYLADGKVFVNASGLELLLFEAPGEIWNKRQGRHSKDHIKGGVWFLCNDSCYSQQYWKRPRATKPCFDGKIISFERMAKVKVTTNHDDKREAIQWITFFWKGMLELSLHAIHRLRDSSDANYLLLEGSDELNQRPLLPSFLKSSKVETC
ncbi:hypothetical protein BCR42DRAFT_444369 [Absidia repens]|uniref:Uncharacterized protein n=1 Tax=Absidia repens TaxID=90262 RepID=A0A1X2HR68_9FUNG|nr:hypothetical protein BCR42DRAFT_444369 [Absidia repens]